MFTSIGISSVQVLIQSHFFLVHLWWLNFVVGGVYLAERLNKLLGENWGTFATQNYFDSHGIFLSTLWSGPLLVIAIIILVLTWSLSSFFMYHVLTGV